MANMFHQVWPPAVLAIGAIATAAWIGALGYGLFELGGMAF
jgi:hypothetical protein